MSRTPLEIIDGAIRVIQSQSKTSGDGADHQADALRKTRAAVAELIATQQELLLEIDRASAHCTDVMQRVPSDTLRRSTDALARCGGSS